MSNILMRLESLRFLLLLKTTQKKDIKLQNCHIKIVFYFSFVFKIQLIFSKIYFHRPPADAAEHTDEISISKDT